MESKVKPSTKVKKTSTKKPVQKKTNISSNVKNNKTPTARDEYSDQQAQQSFPGTGSLPNDQVHGTNPIIDVIDNPLLAEQAELLTISPKKELETAIEAITQIESMSEITRQQLAVRRQRVEMEVENKKLDVAKKTIDGIDKIVQAVTEVDVVERVIKNINTPQDMKMMSEAAERMANTLRMLMNPNVIDELGNRKKKKINLMFKSSGPIEAAVQVTESD